MKKSISISNQIRDAILKVKGVKDVRVERRVIYEVTTYIDEYTGATGHEIRNRIYKKEADIIDESPDLDFDFHVAPSERRDAEYGRFKE
jgi:hypothetical protein